LDVAKKEQKNLLRSLVKNKIIKESEIDKIIGRIIYTTNAEEAAKEADFVNESVTENLENKK
jgi:3-hydroxybutyryl-CoA dehydrogenase